MAHEVPIDDWYETCLLQEPGGEDRSGALADLVLIATRRDPADRPAYLLISAQLGELDNEQIEGLARRPDFPAA